MKERAIKGFGTRLAQIRKDRGLTQAELGERVGVSNRVIAYYEQDDAQPPGALLISLAQTLQVTTDELLGIKRPRAAGRSNGQATIRRGRKPKIEEKFDAIRKLPRGEQRFVIRLLEQILTEKA